MRLFARMDADRHGLILRDDDETAAAGPQIAGEGGRFGPGPGAGREPHGGSGYAPIDTGHFHRAVAKRLMVQFGHEKTSQSPMPRALSWKHPTEHRIVIEGAGEYLSGFRRISTPGHPYLKTSHAHQRRPLPDSTARLRNEGPTPGGCASSESAGPALTSCERDPDLRRWGALGGTRTPNLLIRSQMLYPLSYERWMPR